jgi:hypothetical protein
MTTFGIFLALTTFLFACSNNESGRQGDHAKHDAAGAETSKDAGKKSIPSESKKQIDGADITIKYHSPAVRGRVIWGGLVSYDSVWVTGAHQATSLEVTTDFKVGEVEITAGKYAIFTIPRKNEWTIIVNRNWNQHLTDDYSPAEDVVRINVRPEPVTEVAERLKYEIEQVSDRTANIIISWEKLRVSFLIEIR